MKTLPFREHIYKFQLSCILLNYLNQMFHLKKRKEKKVAYYSKIGV